MAKKSDKLVPNSGNGNGMPANGGKGGSCMNNPPKKNSGKKK